MTLSLKFNMDRGFNLLFFEILKFNLLLWKLHEAVLTYMNNLFLFI